MNKHLKTCLAQRKTNTQTFSSSSANLQEVDLRQHLQDLSAQRPDIFGSKDSLIQAERSAVEGGGQSVEYDGQAANLNRGSGSLAMLLFQQKKLKEEAQNANSNK